MLRGWGVCPTFFFQKNMIRNKKITSYTPSQNYALTLEQAKTHLNILDDSFDALIGDYIASAHVMLYNEAAILVKGAIVGYIDKWQDFRIDVAPVDTIEIYYYTPDNTRVLLASDRYIWNNGLYSYIEMNLNLPSLSDRDFPIEVEVTTLANSDAMVTQALRMMVADFFEMRQSEIMGSAKNISRGTSYQLSLISQRTEI